MCPWRLHCSVIVDNITQIFRSITGQHSCARTESNKEVKSKWLASQSLEKYQCNLAMDVKVIQDRIMALYGIQIRPHTCWTVKKIMKGIVEGKHEQGYKVLLQYMEELKKKNHSSIVLLSERMKGHQGTLHLSDVCFVLNQPLRRVNKNVGLSLALMLAI